MMISYSVAAMVVDRLQPQANRQLTEAEIEASGTPDLDAASDPVGRQILRRWRLPYHWHLPWHRAVDAAADLP